jgi:hypothetical protein
MQVKKSEPRKEISARMTDVCLERSDVGSGAPSALGEIDRPRADSWGRIELLTHFLLATEPGVYSPLQQGQVR